MKIFVAGHLGMVGQALIRRLTETPDIRIITQTREELDLTCQRSVMAFFKENSIDEVYLAAAKVGGILANSQYPADFIYNNLMIELNVINSAYEAGVPKLLFFGSSCIYPKECKQPIVESSLLTGPLEPTNEYYAVAKIAGLKMCDGYRQQHGVDFRSIMPTNLYGPGDNFDLSTSHVVPALIRRFHEAKAVGSDKVTLWGSGSPMREFLHVDDLANAATCLMNMTKNDYLKITTPRVSHVNVGSGYEVSIKTLSDTISEIIGYSGEVEWDLTKPDGTIRKLMCNKVMSGLGWRPKFDLKSGLKDTYQWFQENQL